MMTGLPPDHKNGDAVSRPRYRKGFGGCLEKATRKVVRNARSAYSLGCNLNPEHILKRTDHYGYVRSLCSNHTSVF